MTNAYSTNKKSDLIPNLCQSMSIFFKEIIVRNHPDKIFF